MTESCSTPTGCLALADGTVLHGMGFGAEGTAIGELCFNTAMTGYQEILTDPSYAGQVVLFTFPHIGNVGCQSRGRGSAGAGGSGAGGTGDADRALQLAERGTAHRVADAQGSRRFLTVLPASTPGS